MTPEALKQLRAMLRDYDGEEGRYPEHAFEGWAVFRWLVQRVTGESLPHGVPEGWREE